MKDSFASSSFGVALIVLTCVGIIGATIGSKIAFIPSNAVDVVADQVVPIGMATAFILMMLLHGRGKGPGRLIEICIQYGRIRSFAFMLVSAIFFYIYFLAAGDAGLSKAAAFLSMWLPSESRQVDAHILQVRDYSRKTQSLKWVKASLDPDGIVADFTWKKSEIDTLSCRDNKIRLYGAVSWAGFRIYKVECSNSVDKKG